MSIPYIPSHCPNSIVHPFSRKAYNPSRVIGESSIVRVFGLDSVGLVKVVVLKLFGFFDLRH